MADFVYRSVMHDIKQNILNGNYKGMRLPDERSLAESYQVSRSSTKRALGLLADQELFLRKEGVEPSLTLYTLKIRLFFAMRGLI